MEEQGIEEISRSSDGKSVQIKTGNQQNELYAEEQLTPELKKIIKNILGSQNSLSRSDLEGKINSLNTQKENKFPTGLVVGGIVVLLGVIVVLGIIIHQLRRKNT